MTKSVLKGVSYYNFMKLISFHAFGELSHWQSIPHLDLFLIFFIYIKLDFNAPPIFLETPRRFIIDSLHITYVLITNNKDLILV